MPPGSGNAYTIKAMIVVAAMNFGLTSAHAQTEKQKNVMKLLAQAVALDDICPNVRQNTERMLLILLANKIDIEERKFYNYMNSRVEEYKADFRARGAAAACAVAPLVFGPGGAGIPNLLLMR
jgi:hypothetical protein